MTLLGTHGVGERHASTRKEENALKQNGPSLASAREPAMVAGAGGGTGGRHCVPTH